MVIENGKLYKNRTLLYLAPALRVYGELFTAKINRLQKLAFGIFDSALSGSYLEGQPNIFILVSMVYKPSDTLETINWFKYQDYYVTDYMVGQQSKMLVINFPEKLGDAYEKFLQSKYSLMYTSDEIETFFGKPEQADTSQILRKTALATHNHIRKVNEEYKTNMTFQDLKELGSYEVDFPWSTREEIFHF